MNRPDWCPPDVWGKVCGIGASGPSAGYLNRRVARAIIAERERCAKHLAEGCTVQGGEPVDHAVPEILHAIREGLA